MYYSKIHRTLLALLLLWLLGCNASPDADARVSDTGFAAKSGERLYMDVHKLGSGKVELAAVEKAHRADLAIQADHRASYDEYWVDETSGTIYCLVRAPDAKAPADVHREAHGLVADELVEVRPGILPAEPRGHGKLFMCTHLAGPGKITAEAVAEAHKKDLAAQAEHGVNFLRYWYSEATGRIHCLAEAPSREAVIATHEQAHGLVPQLLHEVQRGR